QGFGVPGILSVVCFMLLLVGRQMVGLADVPHIIFAVLGMALMAFELFVMPGTIWFGLLGAIMLAAALIFSSLGPGFSFSSALDRELLLNSTSNLILTTLSTLVLMWAIARFLPETPILRRMALGSGGSIPGTQAPSSFGEAVPAPNETAAGRLVVGALGTAESALRPVGMVRLDDGAGLPVEAISEVGALEPGTRVRVTEVHGARLVVATLLKPDKTSSVASEDESA
ncbi:MAG: membrane-bound serine protease (ClpP class), partial [Planctomycetota bacterium]